jgi:hypothetical protein
MRWFIGGRVQVWLQMRMGSYKIPSPLNPLPLYTFLRPAGDPDRGHETMSPPALAFRINR